MEVLRGPASVQYGSDALGGTIQLLTARPAVGTALPGATGHVEGVVSSSDLGGAIDGGLTLHGAAVGLRVGGGRRDVGDRRAGDGRDSHSALTRYLGLSSDQLYTRLPGTSFEQSGGHVAFTALAGADGLVSGLVLHEEQSGVRRVHRTLGGDGLYRAEATPQQIDFGLFRYERGAVGVLDSLTATLSVNSQQDGRVEQHRPTSLVETDVSRTTAVGYSLQGTTTLPSGSELVVGVEVYDERISADRRFDDPLTGDGTVVRARVPDGTRYTSAGAFAQLSGRYVHDRVFVRTGLRQGHFLFQTRADGALGVGAARVAVGATTFHLSGVVSLTPQLNLTASVGRGFRAPNAFDLGAIGLGGGGFELAAATARQLDAEVGSDDGVGATGTGILVSPL
jgi:hemoglobin/transferrin/lactoferrin receptor protein